MKAFKLETVTNANVKREYFIKCIELNMQLNMQYFLSVPRRRIRRFEVKIHSFLTSTLDAGEWLNSIHACFIFEAG